jgi:bifunctional ADP-heptose synthase (sugar kinase/adenylyltransferase)
MMMDVVEVQAIHQLIALYGHVIDEREWHRLDELFTADVVFDTTGFPGGTVIEGLEALRIDWMHPDKRHPLAHHATNIVVVELGAAEARVLSKGIGVGRKGRVGSVTYSDVLRKDAAGWRIAQRIAVPRSAE